MFVYLGGVVLQEILGLSVYVTATILVVLTGFYVLVGGLRAVIFTEFVQTL